MTLTFVVPVFNSPDLVQALLDHVPQLKAAASRVGDELVEVILSDDGSEPPILEQLAARHVAATEVAGVPIRVLRNAENRGKGYAVRLAVKAAEGERVLMSDADESVPVEEYVHLAKAQEGSAALVCASRYTAAAQVSGLPIRRRILSRVFNILVRVAGVWGIRDTQCGFKLFWMPKMRPVFDALTVDRFAFDVELIVRARQAGVMVVEVPVIWRGGRRSSLRILRDAPRMLVDLIRVMWRV